MSKAATFLGFGAEAVYKVETDEFGAMIPHKLDEAIKEVKQVCLKLAMI